MIIVNRILYRYVSKYLFLSYITKSSSSDLVWGLSLRAFFNGKGGRGEDRGLLARGLKGFLQRVRGGVSSFLTVPGQGLTLIGNLWLSPLLSQTCLHCSPTVSLALLVFSLVKELPMRISSAIAASMDTLPISNLTSLVMSPKGRRR